MGCGASNSTHGKSRQSGVSPERSTRRVTFVEQPADDVSAAPSNRDRASIILQQTPRRSILLRKKSDGNPADGVEWNGLSPVPMPRADPAGPTTGFSELGSPQQELEQQDLDAAHQVYKARDGVTPETQSSDAQSPAVTGHVESPRLPEEVGEANEVSCVSHDVNAIRQVGPGGTPECTESGGMAENTAAAGALPIVPLPPMEVGAAVEDVSHEIVC
eukprot:TRINITY_DN59171_c0_g1_i1.p1 TRINITY_DN59171_c0_g1~~TRINITY_DN59171_c0_g1_i1.p1  ORF type:complete len:217 (+),score=19.48 TRINITY_DN59171_c0_g1_i1:219-869(+)